MNPEFSLDRRVSSQGVVGVMTGEGDSCQTASLVLENAPESQRLIPPLQKDSMMGNLLELAPQSEDVAAVDKEHLPQESADERPATPPIPACGEKSALEASLELSKCEDVNQGGNSQIGVGNQGEFNEEREDPEAEKGNKATDPMSVDAVAQTSLPGVDHDSSFEQLKTDRALEANSSSFSTSSLDTSNPGRQSNSIKVTLSNFFEAVT